VMLGKALFTDTSLSTPDGQSCASCHFAPAGFADPDWQIAVSAGATAGRYGSRNAPSIAYCRETPALHFDPDRGGYVGGLYRDGRMPNLGRQAIQPFFNPLEMNNSSRRAVVREIQQSHYASLFERVYGSNDWRDAERIFDLMIDALVAYERSAELNRFDSKFDHFMRGEGTALSAKEQWGLELFEGEAGCTACHPSSPGPAGQPPLFTDYTYHDLAVPRNPANPFYALPAPYNHAGQHFVDLGLGAVIGDPAELGKFKVPTLRNVAATAPYMHNGVFATLRETIEFLAAADGPLHPPSEFGLVSRAGQGSTYRLESGRRYIEPGLPGGGSPPPESPGLSPAEIDALHAFLLTLTDGYQN
ncbi:MAG TPA: cytochrome c peroxidase, partial [Candidatus Polarisedimenticolia bacterium]|nr:cytochrome c peroxidase [Candidatus Polarisedimenticolia bacterium]